MPGYDFENGVKAWTKSAFGLFIGFTFFYVFNSGFLAILAVAFFFFVPLTNRNAENIINKSLFGGLMLILLFWAFGPFGTTGLGLDLGISGTSLYSTIGLFIVVVGFSVAAGITKKSWMGLAALGAFIVTVFVAQPWSWPTTAIIFIGVWLIGLVSGVASGQVEDRTTIGVVVLVVAFVIYTIGPGSQDVGASFFGQWWPTIYNSVSTLTGPIGNVWSQFSKTFGDAFQLLTCPVCYATQLMNGSYATNPLGPTGAYGVDLTTFEVTPVFIEQPYQITANIKNNGVYDAEKVSITLTSGSDSPMVVRTTSSQRATIKDLGIDTNKCKNDDKDYRCVYYFDDKQDNIFSKQNIWQTYFMSNGINCQAAGTYQIRKKYLPVNITLKYDYTTDSSLGKGADKLEFISMAEWDRLAKLDKLQLKDVQSEYTTGPVKLSLGTPGLKSPIREDQDFHIGVNLLSAQKGGKIESIEYVQLNYPPEFDLDKCTPNPDSNDKSQGIVVWKPTGTGDKYFFCHFFALQKDKSSPSKLGGSPTKSYVITSKAKYTYSVSQNKIMKVEFGSWCCTQEPIKDSCASNMQCCPEDKKSGKGICAPLGQNCEGGTSGGTATGGTSTSGCCESASEFGWQCSDASSAQVCIAPATFVSNGVCNQGTHRCEGCSIYDNNPSGCSSYSSTITYKALKCEYDSNTNKCNTVPILLP